MLRLARTQGLVELPRIDDEVHAVAHHMLENTEQTFRTSEAVLQRNQITHADHPPSIGLGPYEDRAIHGNTL